MIEWNSKIKKKKKKKVIFYTHQTSKYFFQVNVENNFQQKNILGQHN